MRRRPLVERAPGEVVELRGACLPRDQGALGSLAPGKLADLVVTDGDLLEIRTRVEQLYVEGRPLPLTNRQTELYDEYRARLERLQAAAKR